MISAKCKHGQTPFTCLICQQDSQYLSIIQENAKLKDRIKELECMMEKLIQAVSSATKSLKGVEKSNGL